jgi:hypothetical protein
MIFSSKATGLRADLVIVSDDNKDSPLHTLRSLLSAARYDLFLSDELIASKQGPNASLKSRVNTFKLANFGISRAWFP